MLYFLPIEPIESRYTAQMLRWVVDELEQLNVDFQVIIPDTASGEITSGQFLDICDTISWKADQISIVANLFKKDMVKDGDKFLIGDLWFPGLDAIPYMSILSGIRTEIWGWHYAGCSDRTDFVQPVCHAGGWLTEAAWLKMCEGIFVGSRFHENLLRQYFENVTGPLNIYSIGLVWNYWDVRSMVTLKPLNERPKRVIFPHRGAPEKNPEAFYRLARMLNDPTYEFIITSSRSGAPEALGFRQSPYWEVRTGLSKQEYYNILADSRVFFSAAHQETFGYALQEAITCNVTPVCPVQAAYPNILKGSSAYLYTDEWDGIQKVAKYLEEPIGVDVSYTTQFHRSAREALRIMGYAR